MQEGRQISMHSRNQALRMSLGICTKYNKAYHIPSKLRLEKNNSCYETMETPGTYFSKISFPRDKDALQVQ